jgi:hypothetical protein
MVVWCGQAGRQAGKQKRQRVVGFVGVGRRIGYRARSMQKEPRARTLESSTDDSQPKPDSLKTQASKQEPTADM